MAYTWEPRWEKYRVECYGIIIHTCRDRVTKIIACPICIDALSRCLSRETSIAAKSAENIFFHTEEDLIIHIREYHATRFLRKVAINERE